MINWLKAKLKAPIIDLEKVLTEKNGQLYLNGVIIDKKKQQDLKTEARLFKNTKLWDILTNTLESQAYEAGWTRSKTLEDLMNGKAISYTIDVQRKILDKIERAH